MPTPATPIQSPPSPGGQEDGRGASGPHVGGGAAASAAGAPATSSERFQGVGETTIPEATLEYWKELDDDSRKDWYTEQDAYYENLLEEFRASANHAVEDYRNSSTDGQRWRFWLIVLTGGLALINVLASSWPDDPHQSQIRVWLSFVAAIYAVLLALATNLESFRNYADKKQTARESRELFLDAYREFEMLRVALVTPFGYAAQGCFNLNLLYRRLVSKDAELRRKLKQLTTTGGDPAAVSSS
jgi:hypothetical protein